MDPLAITAHVCAMDAKEQGRLLRAWREHIGARRGIRLTLETLAAELSLLAEEEGIPSTSRKVPGTWASLSRWENGVSEQSPTGMRLIAKHYKVDVQDLMGPPPSAPTHTPATETDSDLAHEIVKLLRARK